MKKFLTVFLLLIFSSSFGENPCGLMFPRETWGVWGDGGVYIPLNTALPVYNQDLTKVGVIERSRYYVKFRTSSNQEFQIDGLKDLEYIGHYEYAFIRAIQSETDGLFEVLINSNYNQESKLFVKLDEVFGVNGDFCTYGELLFDQNIPDELLKGKEMANIGINLSTICLNLRKSPTIQSQRIACFGTHGLNGLTKLSAIKSEGKWMKVTIEYCKTENIDNSDMDEGGCGGCCCKVKEDKYIGWMKAISENGFPNIWYSVTSY